MIQWVYQTVHLLSYREVLSLAQDSGLTVPCAGHERVCQFDPEPPEKFIDRPGKRLLQQKQRHRKSLSLSARGLAFVRSIGATG